MSFTYHSKQEGNIHVFHLSGNLIEKSQADTLLQDINDSLAKNRVLFLVDLKELKYLNSIGLAILIQILTKSRKAGGETVITHVNSKINELLVITKLNTVFMVAETVEQGISKLNTVISN
jgi:anti-sigma B factor antagonist